MAKTSFELAFLALGMLSALQISSGFPSGAPDYLCKSMKPLHRTDGQPLDTLPFTVTADRTTVPPGGVVTVTIANRTQYARFEGLLAVASDARDDVVTGMVLPPPSSNMKRQDCTVIKVTVPDSAITHSVRMTANRASFQWRAPADAVPGSRYTIRVTVVQFVSTFWVGVPVPITIGNDVPRTPSRLPGSMTSGNTGTSTQRVDGTTGVNTNRPSTGSRMQPPSIPPTSISTGAGRRIQPPSPSSSVFPQRQPHVGSQPSRFSSEGNLVNGPNLGLTTSTNNPRRNRNRGRGRGRGMQAWLAGWFQE